MVTAATGDPGTPTAFEAASGTGWLVELRGTPANSPHANAT
jgi:hypothetical protein